MLKFQSIPKMDIVSHACGTQDLPKSNVHLVGKLVVVVVELVFDGPSIHFRSFRARSVNLATLF